MRVPSPPIVGLFPDNTCLDADGALMVAGCRLADVADNFQTPVYVVDEGALRAQAQRYLQIRSHRSGSMVAFASKSFPCRAVYRLMFDEGLLVDVAGLGELLMALDAGVDAGRIILHGNAKTNSELTLAVGAKVGTIVLDGLDEIERLDAFADAPLDVLLRVQPGVDARTEAAISTGHRGSKFGVCVEDVPSALARIRRTRWLGLKGLHIHLGSQLLHLDPLLEAMSVIGSLGSFDVYDIGGGLGVQYTLDQSTPTVEHYLDVVTAAAARYLPVDSQLIVEPGRSLVARSTTTVYRVITVKPGTPTFVAVDGGMADNLEASTYVGQRFEATMVDRVGGGELVDLVGRQCESGDLLAAGVPLQDPRPGDLVAMPMTGAYTHTLVNNYNGALRPAVVFCADGVARAVVRRDTHADLLARELPWP